MKKLTLETAINAEIDWSKPMWVQALHDPTQIVLTTGEHIDDSFEGTCLPCDIYPQGDYSFSWAKGAFKPLQGEISFIISNND